MPTRKFSELIDALPADRSDGTAARITETIAGMHLDELRRARKMTQASLGQHLGVNQGEISKIEHRTDLYLSTMSEYVEHLGASWRSGPFSRIRKSGLPNLNG